MHIGNFLENKRWHCEVLMSAAAIFAELSALIQLPPIPRPHSRAARRDFRQHVVIIGGGFAGLASAVALRHAPVRMTLIDRRNYHLFPAAALPGRHHWTVACRYRLANPLDPEP
jgi:hypothetical protein